MIVSCTILLALHLVSRSGATPDTTPVGLMPPARILDTCQALKDEAAQIRDEGYEAINRADSIRERAYRVQGKAIEMKEEALEMKEEALEMREETASALESRLVETLVDTLALLRSEANDTNLYRQEIKSILKNVEDRIEKLESKMTTLKKKISEQKNELTNSISDQTTVLEGQTAALEKQMTAIEEQKAVSTAVSQKVSETLATALTLKDRQQAWLSEVRLISLYKMSGQTSTDPGYGHEAELISDGQFGFSGISWNSMATYSQTANRYPNNKLWLELGGLFRISKIKVWNIRHSSVGEIVGTKILADEKLVGSITQARSSYDFTVADNDPTYARKVTLHQPRAQNLHILELQVWGSGPFSVEDKFA